MFNEQTTDSVGADVAYDEQLDEEFFSDEDSGEELDEIDTFVLDESDSDAFVEQEAVFA